MMYRSVLLALVGLCGVALADECKDKSVWCKDWASSHMCDHYPDYMKTECPQSCDHCKVDVGIPVHDSNVVPFEQLLVAAANSSEDFDFFWDTKNGLVKTEYDVIMPLKEWEQSFVEPGAQLSAGIIPSYKEKRWTNDVVNYEIAPGHFSAYDVQTIKSALSDWTKYTCLTFRQTSTARNRIRMQNAGGCMSLVGMNGGAQMLGLGYGCRYKRTVLHEVGHAIGLHHEQTRPDRDNYVNIHYENIPGNIAYNFKKYTWSYIMNMGIPYDYLSIMHYGATAFSNNGRMTIETKDPRYRNVIGNQMELSFSDIKAVNIMYKCGKGCSLKDSDCPGSGFVGKDCTCWCPGKPYKKCDGTEVGTKVTPVGGKVTTESPIISEVCFDENRMCRSWAADNLCSITVDFMSKNCKRSCNLCNTETKPKITPKPEEKVCEDERSFCASWSGSGYCTDPTYSKYVKSICRKSCNLCQTSEDVTTTSKPAPVTVDPTCVDEEIACPAWKGYGFCEKYSAFLSKKCKKSCGGC